MIATSPRFFSLLLGIAFLSLAQTDIVAARDVNLCSRVGPYSVADAQDLINRGDEILRNTTDCSQVNMPFCDEAASMFYEANNHLRQVILDSSSGGCLTCDLETVENYVILLNGRESELMGYGYANSVSDVWNDFARVQTYAYCPGVGPGSIVSPNPPSTVSPNPPSGVAPLPPAATSCAPITEQQNARMEGGKATVISSVDLNVCQDFCESALWCKSFDYDWATSNCYLQETNSYPAAIHLFVPNFTHYQCDGRR